MLSVVLSRFLGCLKVVLRMLCSIEGCVVLR